MVERFGGYTLLRRLGRGGMAEVYLARTRAAGGMRRLLAIKRLLGAFNADDQLVSMLADEARLSVWLYHPNIVQVFDFGQQEGTHYIAMEFVDGCDLTKLIRRPRAGGRPLPLPTALYVMTQVMDALDYAHRRVNDHGEPMKIIHRDVSPHNVLVSREGQVKLADFGLARASISVHQSAAGVIRGKFSYMPKEQAHGTDIDHRIDIFAAGVTLYEALTGVKPYNASNLAQQLYQLEQPVPPPSSHVADIPVEIDELAMQAISPDAADRYQTAAEMADDLRHALATVSTPSQEQQQLAALVRNTVPPLPEVAEAQEHPGLSIFEMQVPKGSLIGDEIRLARMTLMPRSERRDPGERHRAGSASIELASDELEDADTAQQRRGEDSNYFEDMLEPVSDVETRLQPRPTAVGGAISNSDVLAADTMYETIVDERRRPSPAFDHGDETFDEAKTVRRDPEEAMAAFKRALARRKEQRAGAPEEGSTESRAMAQGTTPIAPGPRRDRKMVAALALAALALIGLGLASGWMLREKVRERRTSGGGAVVPVPPAVRGGPAATVKPGDNQRVVTKLVTPDAAPSGASDAAAGSGAAAAAPSDGSAAKGGTKVRSAAGSAGVPDAKAKAKAGSTVGSGKKDKDRESHRRTRRRTRVSSKPRHARGATGAPPRTRRTVSRGSGERSSRARRPARRGAAPQRSSSSAQGRPVRAKGGRGVLVVMSSRPGRVLINDRVAGRAPVKIALPPDIYRVKVLYQDSQMFSSTQWITVNAGKASRVSF